MIISVYSAVNVSYHRNSHQYIIFISSCPYKSESLHTRCVYQYVQLLILYKLEYFQHLTRICIYQDSSIIATTQIVTNMKRFVFLLFAVFLQANLITNSDSKVIQNNDGKTLKNDIGVNNQLTLKSRGEGRIIGGHEIKPHSQPWLALLCSTNIKGMW